MNELPRSTTDMFKTCATVYKLPPAGWIVGVRPNTQTYSLEVNKFGMAVHELYM